MSKKDDFKIFVSKNSNFAKNVNEGKTSWQKLYELYDLYGEDNEVWEDFRSVKETAEVAASALSVKGIINSLKGINLSAFQENISSIQKAVGFLEDLTKDAPKKKEDKTKGKKPVLDPMDRFYSD